MARFDVHAMTGQRALYLLDRLDTRVVVPLFAEEEAPPPLCGGRIWARPYCPWMSSISGS